MGSFRSLSTRKRWSSQSGRRGGVLRARRRRSTLSWSTGSCRLWRKRRACAFDQADRRTGLERDWDKFCTSPHSASLYIINAHILGFFGWDFCLLDSVGGLIKVSNDASLALPSCHPGPEKTSLRSQAVMGESVDLGEARRGEIQRNCAVKIPWRPKSFRMPSRRYPR